MNTLYRFYANDGTLLYIGITISPPQRFKQHSRDKAWWNEVARIELVQFNSREELENEEKNAISREHPKYNITHNAAAPQAGRPDTYSRWPGGSGPCPTCRRTVIYLRNRQQYIHADDYTPWCGDGKIQPSAEEQLDAIRQGTSEAVWDMLRDRDVSFIDAISQGVTEAVWDMLLRRRQLNPGQVAMVASDLEPLFAEAAKQRQRESHACCCQPLDIYSTTDGKETNQP